MGSVVVSEVVHNPAHFPHSTMLATPHAPAYQPPHHATSSNAALNTSNAPRARSSTSSSAAATRPSQQAAPSQHTPSPHVGTTQEISPNAYQQHTAPTAPVASSGSSSAAQSSSPSSPSLPTSPSPTRIKIKDLQHIQSFVEDESSIPSLAATGQIPADKSQGLPQYEISAMPVTDVIEMVAGLLTKITTTNDEQAEQLHRDIPSPDKMSPLANSVLAFHGKNVPTISIMSYLTRIHKYCPATYEVFLSLLVYFDRITDKINLSPPNTAHPSAGSNATRAPLKSEAPSNTTSHSLRTSASDLREADRPGEGDAQMRDTVDSAVPSEYPSPPLSESDPYNLAQFFVVDSFNIHRLIIAGVTCASKFFSDVFYTNSRYAKVGGLPLQELNNLEVQFLLLNDFRLSITVEELEAYGTMLVEFYAREVIAQKQERQASGAADANDQ